MENAVKALLIAAGVLIGIMVLSLGVALFSSLSEFSGNTQKQIEENAVQKFNEQFTRYIDTNLTIHDVITAANTARESNVKYGLTGPSDNNYYVSIHLKDVVDSVGIKKDYNNLEKEIDDAVNISDLLNKCMERKYKCTITNVKSNPITGRVYEVTFSEIAS